MKPQGQDILKIEGEGPRQKGNKQAHVVKLLFFQFCKKKKSTEYAIGGSKTGLVYAIVRVSEYFCKSSS
ncbi:hypothetical protein C5O22_04230 [Treponema sp. J25]|nr:hypothetical protein C5O22_04230 [Treponema sp. J25]